VGSCGQDGGFSLTTTPAEGNVLGGVANLSTDSGLVEIGAPLLAVFASYQAELDGSDVKVSWMTASEIDTLGYHVFWGTSADEASMSRPRRG